MGAAADEGLRTLVAGFEDLHWNVVKTIDLLYGDSLVEESAELFYYFVGVLGFVSNRTEDCLVCQNSERWIFVVFATQGVGEIDMS